MSRWTHPMCWTCWFVRFGDEVPARVLNVVKEKCCFCGNTALSGIYVRHYPDDPELVCNGKHGDEQ